MSSSHTDWGCYFEFKRDREQNISKKKIILGLYLTSLKTLKSEEPKEANHLADQTFLFVNIGSVICFPMPIGTKFELEVAKISVSAGFLKDKYEVKSNQSNFY